ncbi:MAG: right-handed parallel beta-helix repeat-containing protein [Candidatus Omnitrophica bacterium]|nr:right-handed parallel beta-helix repeat-containing protein [Candidatus Omnitrophota bacterium]
MTVKENVKADSVTFTGDRADFPAAPLEGELFYNSTLKTPKYFDGTTWQGFGGSGPKTVGSKIVAAANSLDKTKADYVCDGTADQLEIQQAIDDLGTVGGAVYLLEGTYNISGAINLDNVAPVDSNKSIIGAGAGTVLKLVTGTSNVNVINASNVNRILISQLMIDGSNMVSSIGIYLGTVTYSKIDKVWVKNNQWCIYLLSSSNNTITSNDVQGTNNQYNIYLNSSSNNTITDNNIQAGQAISIHLLSSSNNNIIANNNVQGNNQYGIYLLSSSNNNTIANNNVQGNGQAGIVISVSSNNNTITGNDVQGNGSGIATNSSSNNTITSNTVQGNSGHGIFLVSASNSIVTSNIVYDNGGTGTFGGINVVFNSDNNLISSNRIFDSASTGYGINITPISGPFTSDCDKNYIVGNLIDGAGYIDSAIPPTYDRRISDAGAFTKYTDKTKMTLEKKEISGISGNYTLDVAASPQTYISFNPTGAVTLTLANGKAAGDLLILENIQAANSVSLSEGANVNLGVTPRVLGQYDTLELIWNGTVAEGGTGKWLEVKYTDN